jgi:hypothetical protein
MSPATAFRLIRSAWSAGPAPMSAPGEGDTRELDRGAVVVAEIAPASCGEVIMRRA